MKNLIRKILREGDFEWTEDTHEYGTMIAIHTDDGIKYVTNEKKSELVDDDMIWYDPSDNKWYG